MPLFDGLNVPLVICGHTHMQFDRTIGTVRVVNAGSVGMPFQAPGAYWLLCESDVQLRCTAYNLTGAADRIRATGLAKAHKAEVYTGDPEFKAVEGEIKIVWL